MARRYAGVLALLLASMLVCAGQATAAKVSIDDRRRDAGGNGLEITRVTVDNRDRAVFVTVRFAKLRRGDVVVSLDPRRATGVRIVSSYRPGRAAVSWVVRGALTENPTIDGDVDCDGLKVRWSRSLARMRMPARCLHGGNYGALRFAVLTERDGADIDQAPQTKTGDLGTSRWVPRG